MTEVYITTALFILLTVVFWKGKGTWLIAGYNMINDKEKEKYSRKKLCRLMSVCMGICSFLLLIMCILGEERIDEYAHIFAVIIIITVIITVILANTLCRK